MLIYFFSTVFIVPAGSSLSARRRTEVRRGTLKACATEYRHPALAH